MTKISQQLLFIFGIDEHGSLTSSINYITTKNMTTKLK